MEDNVIMKPLQKQFQININPFVPKAPFFSSLKTSEIRKVFYCLQGVEKGCFGDKWVKYLQSDQCPYSQLNLTKRKENFATNLLKFVQTLQKNSILDVR